MTTHKPSHRETALYLRTLADAGRSDIWIAQRLGLRTIDALRKWRDNGVRPRPKLMAKLRALAMREGTL